MTVLNNADVDVIEITDHLWEAKVIGDEQRQKICNKNNKTSHRAALRMLLDDLLFKKPKGGFVKLLNTFEKIKPHLAQTIRGTQQSPDNSSDICDGGCHFNLVSLQYTKKAENMIHSNGAITKESCNAEFNLFLLRDTPDDATDRVAKQSSRLQSSITCRFDCSTKIYDPEGRSHPRDKTIGPGLMIYSKLHRIRLHALDAKGKILTA